MLQIAICEDTPEHARQLSELVEAELQEQRSEIEEFRSPEELLRYIVSGSYAPEIALIGIEAGEGGGIALAQRLNELLPACRIIFLSDDLRDVREAYRAAHVWFILRGELGEHLPAALQKALSLPDSGRGAGLLIRGKGKAMLIPLDEIYYLERACRRTLIQTEKGSFVSAERPCRLLAGEAEQSFIRSHRSYWVNRKKIRAIEHDEFVLQNAQRIPISRSWRVSARAAFFGGEG